MPDNAAPPEEPEVRRAAFAQGDPLLPAAHATRPAHRLSHPLRIRRLSAHVFRAPIAAPVVTSFGVMRDRPAVLLRVEDADGAHGWGEIWSNFPSCGAEHRARLATSAFAPALFEREFADPAEAFMFLERRLRILALQAAEWGPFAQVLAGIDVALWDLAARRAGLRVAELLGGERETVPAYASGINLDGAAQTVAACRGEGYRAFKVKIGFGAERDRAAIAEVAGGLEPGEELMLDANQAWDLDEALRMARSLEAFGARWLEEPLPADRPAAEWQALAAGTRIPLAGGENLRGWDGFADAIASGSFGVMQPDACKWGGLTGSAAVARKALAAGLRYCPHYLGAGVGLVASAHLLAAAGGDGLLEVDSNPNPLRELLALPYPQLREGQFPLPKGPGLGVEPDLLATLQWRVWSEEVHA